VEVIRKYLDDVAAAAQAVDLAVVEQAIGAMEAAYRGRHGVFAVGNGGSAANASHFAQDLAKGALRDDAAIRFPVLSLVDSTPFLTAVANDIGYEDVFVFQLRQFAKPGDWLIAVSGSGNSPNIIKAVDFARDLGVRVMGFTGFDGGRLRTLSDISVHVPLEDMCQTEAVHSVLMHLIVDVLRDRLALPKADTD
jgi:D-sedoheptulose 7-phosphate isomerase